MKGICALPEHPRIQWSELAAQTSGSPEKNGPFSFIEEESCDATVLAYSRLRQGSRQAYTAGMQL